MLAALGLWRLGRLQGRRLAWCWALGAVGNTVYFFDYRVFDLEVFFLPAAAMLASCTALGLDQALAWLKGIIDEGRTPRWVQAVIALGLVLKAWGAYPDRDLSNATEARDYAADLGEYLPPSAIMVTYTSPPEWRYYTVFRWYYQLVSRQRLDVYVYVFPSSDFVRALLADGYEIYAFAESPLLDEFELVALDQVVPDLVRVELPTQPDEGQLPTTNTVGTYEPD
jgi:hypothetical protein